MIGPSTRWGRGQAGGGAGDVRLAGDPQGRSLSAWPLLAEDGVHYNQIVGRVIEFWPYLKKGPHVTSSTFSGGMTFPFVGIVLKGASGADLSRAGSASSSVRLTDVINALGNK